MSKKFLIHWRERERERERECACVWCACVCVVCACVCVWVCVCVWCGVCVWCVRACVCVCVCVVCACVCTRVCRGCNNSKEYPSWCNFVCTISNEYSVIIVFHILPVENPTQKKYGLMVWYQVTMVATVYIYCIQSSSSIWKMMCY